MIARNRRVHALARSCELADGAREHSLWAAWWPERVSLAAHAQASRLRHAQMGQPVDLGRLRYHAEAVCGSQHVALRQWEWHLRWCQ